jgi:hypothetical protein
MNLAESGRLLARYLDGEMSPDERRRFMDVILADQDLYNAFAEESILAEMLEDAEFQAKVNAVLQPPPSVWERTGLFFRSLSAGWRVLIVAAMAAILLVPSVAIYRAKQHPQAVVARKEAPPRQPAPVNSPATPTPPGPAVSNGARSGILTSALATLTLVPKVRGTDKPGNVLALRQQPNVRLNMGFEKGHYASYRVVLASPDTGFKKEFDNLQPYRRRDGGFRLVLQVPSSLLPNGDYTVTIYGLSAAGAADLDGYSFSITRSK